VTGTVSLDAQADAIGLQKGKTYPLDLFQAERHTKASHFRIDTNLAFTQCGIFVPDIPK
jgi:fibro-slime domain-containing protein